MTIHPLLAARRSRRAIDPHREVEVEVLARVLEAGRWAASRNNVQPWRFLVFDRVHGGDPAGRETAESLLRRGNAWAKAAPVLILSAAVHSWPEVKEGRDNIDDINRHAAHDVGQATASMHLQATAEGLVFHQMAGYDHDRARTEFGFPDDADPVAMIAIGHPLDLALVEDERIADRDRAPRTRLPAEDVVWGAGWGKAR